MKKWVVFIFLSVMMLPAGLKAEDFLGAPVIPGGKMTLKTESRLEMTAPVSHDKVVEFYQEALAGYQDIKFRDWKDYTYIEDDGNLSWHSITISKQDTEGATIVIVKDNHRQGQLDLDYRDPGFKIYWCVCRASFAADRDVHFRSDYLQVLQGGCPAIRVKWRMIGKPVVLSFDTTSSLDSTK